MTIRFARFWGVRGSCPAPFETRMRTGGNTPCVEVRDGDHLLICDAGTGIVPLGEALLRQDRIREITLLLSHYHWDHIAGLPFFLPAFTPGWKINLFAPGKTQADIEKYLSKQMQRPFFPVGTDVWLADIEYIDVDKTVFTHGPLRIERFDLHHPGDTYGYRIQVGESRIVYAPDNELTFSDGKLAPRHRSAMAFMRGVDVLIHDAQYTAEDYQKKRGWGHACYVDTVNMAVDSGVKDLYLFHHDYAHDDKCIDRLHRHALKMIRERNGALGCHVSREGETIDL